MVINEQPKSKLNTYKRMYFFSLFFTNGKICILLTLSRRYYNENKNNYICTCLNCSKTNKYSPLKFKKKNIRSVLAQTCQRYINSLFYTRLGCSLFVTETFRALPSSAFLLCIANLNVYRWQFSFGFMHESKHIYVPH